jgi:hypothetical protein
MGGQENKRERERECRRKATARELKGEGERKKLI